MLGEADAPGPLILAPGGAEDPQVLSQLRVVAERLRAAGADAFWLMVDDGEVVGSCCHKRPPLDGETEIGYGVAASRRRLGHATRAVAEMVRLARQNPRLSRLTAATAVANTASQRALAANGFVETGRDHDDEDGDLILWGVSVA